MTALVAVEALRYGLIVDDGSAMGSLVNPGTLEEFASGSLSLTPIGPAALFSDGFENGNADSWSTLVPGS